MTNREYALLAGKTLSAKKAQDIVIIDIQGKASFADFFVICSGTSERQINTLVDDVEEAFAKEGLLVKSVEGKQNSGWILMDFGDIIVNLFTKEMREKYRTVDYLLIDDIQFISDKEGTQEEFFHTFNELYQNNKYIIISSDRPPKDLPTFMDRLISRFQDGAPTDIIPPDFETRIAILKNKASQLKLDIPDDVYSYIAKNIKSNIRELEGAIKKIMLHQMFMKQKIDVSLAEEALKDIINEKKKKITPDHIIALVERTFNLKENELKSNSRSQKITYPRQIAMYLLKTHTNLSLKQIAACFNKKDHTTIMYAVEKIVSAIDNDSATSKIISDIEKDLQA